MKKCESCGFVLVDNDDPLKVLKMLRKRTGDKEKYPMLIADFYCEKVQNNECDFAQHVKWNNLMEDVNINQCPKCEGKILSSVFLGVLKGLHLESYCFNCYNKRSGGSLI
jgi:hypothetical protein